MQTLKKSSKYQINVSQKPSRKQINVVQMLQKLYQWLINIVQILHLQSNKSMQKFKSCYGEIYRTLTVLPDDPKEDWKTLVLETTKPSTLGKSMAHLKHEATFTWIMDSVSWGLGEVESWRLGEVESWGLGEVEVSESHSWGSIELEAPPLFAWNVTHEILMTF